MIDRVIDYDDQSIEAVKNFTINEPYAQGHFPGNPIMPGVMMIESMAQASTILAFKYIENRPELTKYFTGFGVLFSAADEVRFKQVIYPGDQMRIHSKLTRNARNLFEFECRIEVEKIIVCYAKLKAIAGA
jgi:3-hydroxyacyl-[acyl-carrier-protein] dehydratase